MSGRALDDSRGHASNNLMAGGKRLRDDRVRPDNGSITEHDTRHQDAAESQPAVTSDLDAVGNRCPIKVGTAVVLRNHGHVGRPDRALSDTQPVCSVDIASPAGGQAAQNFGTVVFNLEPVGMHDAAGEMLVVRTGSIDAEHALKQPVDEPDAGSGARRIAELVLEAGPIYQGFTRVRDVSVRKLPPRHLHNRAGARGASFYLQAGALLFTS